MRRPLIPCFWPKKNGKMPAITKEFFTKKNIEFSGIIILAVIIVFSMAACSGKSGGSSGKTTTGSSGGETSYDTPDDSDSPGAGSCGGLKYDPLYESTDYMYEQFKFTEKFTSEFYKHTETYRDSGNFAFINGNLAPAFLSPLELGKYDGLPVTRTENGCIVTWKASGEVQPGDPSLDKQNCELVATLDKSTNTITYEVLKKFRDGRTASRLLTEYVLLPDETVLSSYFMYSYYLKPPDDVVIEGGTANVFKYNSKKEELLAYVGLMKVPSPDFDPPSVVGKKDLDQSAYDAFANCTSIYTIKGSSINIEGFKF